MSSRKQLDQERAKLDAAKAKFREAKKQFEIDKRKLETEKKALKSEKNRLAKEKKQLKSKNAKLNKNMRKQLMSPVSASAGNDSFFGGSPRSPRGGGGGDGKYQKKYEIETKKTRELRSKVGDLEAQIKSLSRKLKYGGKGGGNSKDLERRMRNLQKELRVQKRKLKLALLDMEKTAGFYRKEVERFKTRQTKWINEQQLKIKNRKVIKYVFADDITKIQLRKAGRGGGIKIWTKDGDEAVFTDVDVVLPENYVQKGENEDDYDDVLKEVKEDDTLENDEPEDDLKYEESDDEEDLSQELAEPLMQELERRMQDIKSIEQLIFQAKYMAKKEVIKGDTIKSSIETLVSSVKERHDKLRTSLGIEDDEDEEDDDEENDDGKTGDDAKEQSPNKEMLKALVSNNRDWREMVSAFPFEFISILSFELDDRIVDLAHILNILRQKDERQFETVTDLMKVVEKRHTNVWRPWTNGAMDDNEDTINTIKDNNDRWRQCVEGTNKVEQEAKEARERQAAEDQREPTPPPQEKKIEYWIFRDPERNKFIKSLGMSNVVAAESKEDDGNGGSIIAHVARFLNRVIPVSDDIINDYANIEELYLPIDSVRGKKDVTEFNELNDFTYESQIVASCFDGVLMAILVNMVEPDYIDLRAIHLPKQQTDDDEKNAGYDSANDGEIVPLPTSDIRENIATVMSSIKALDLGLPAWTVDDYFDPSLTSTMIVTMIITLFRAMMDSQVNVKMHPELIRLAQTDEEKENAPQISSSEWLRRWLIYMKNPVLKRHNRNKSGASSGSLALTISLQELAKGDPEKSMHLTPTPETDDNGGNYTSPMQSGMGGLARRKLTLSSVSSNASTTSDANDKGAQGEAVINYCLPKRNWHDDLLLICSKFDSNFNPMDVKNESPNIYEQCKKILKSIKQSIKVRTVITADDLATLNPLLQEMFIADILDKNSNIEKISTQEKKRLTKIIKPKSKDDSSMIAWINALGGKGLHINNLERDMADGLVILKLLNYAQPGCVDWKLVRKKVRHKFDKLSNCKVAVDVATKEFPFSLVGIAGNDIVDGNQKYIRTLLWQIMRYHALKQLSELNYGGKTVTDADMLKWANDKVAQFKSDNLDSIDAALFAKSNLSSWKDKTLSNCIFYLNLIASINSSWVDWTLVYPIPFDKSGLSDTFSKERTANARYTMTIVRRLGGELFMMNEDLCRVESRAVLSLIASIMTIEAKERKKEEENKAQNAENGDDIPTDLDAVIDTGDDL